MKLFYSKTYFIFNINYLNILLSNFFSITNIRLFFYFIYYYKYLNFDIILRDFTTSLKKK